MNQNQALALAEELEALAALRRNTFWLNRVLPELVRRRDDARDLKRDRALPPAVRCEHSSVEDLAQDFLEFCDTEEKRLRRLLAEFDKKSPIIERPFSIGPSDWQEE